MTSNPPTRLIPSIPIPPSVALTYLSKYLSQTSTNAYLLPNAKLEPSGPTAGATNSSLTLSNLQRVEAGLKGEWLAPVLELEETAKLEAEGEKKAGEEGEWQNLEDYQLEQQDLEGEVGERVNVVAQDGDEMVGGEEGNEVEIEAVVPKKAKRKHEGGEENGASVKKPKDKEARKAEKKERAKQERRAKAEAAKKAAETAAMEESD
ncbi:hypothetical protein GLAREA_07448 [Glarea lozoyensis ATCC 20868]|uniref:Uncharacterized protein n=2 Tax=Glarea lozoyensis TaxID=101852 RepID=S3D3H9_GLAL2|nr:uncharacterized protein GLAREA_07448 [Glarea lozoyensis ATCC 20868]EHK96813.1 hypothetical protein M7I_7436 [Glarea lozoyensis 74030]EPE32315.1 hypothetical protein GLAREA_07448 [Glarea lozoyensis ATCC 20868]